MLLRKFLLSIVTALTLWSLPLVVFADGGHGGNDIGSMTIGPIPATFGFAVVVGAVVYMLPSIQVNMLQLAIITLGTATAVIHFFVGVGGEALLFLNAAGYVALLVALFTPISPLTKLRPILRISLLVYTIITFIAYFMLHSVDQYGTLEIATKATELGLVILLIMRLWQLGGDGKEQALHDVTAT